MAKLLAEKWLRKNIIKMVFMVLFIILPGNSYADYWCTGTVSYIGQSADGLVMANNGFGVHILCSISREESQSLANKDTCKGWYTQLLGAKLTGKRIILHYQDSTGKDSSFCSSIGNWVWPQDKIYFVAIVD